MIFRSSQLRRLDDFEVLTAYANRFSPLEMQYLSGLAKPVGSMCARHIMKDLLLDFFAKQGQNMSSQDLEILPMTFRKKGDPAGVPTLHTPHDTSATEIKLSLSHSATHAMAALLVIRKD